jgi:RNA polymerase sigma-70 factor (ECF subfamily)
VSARVTHTPTQPPLDLARLRRQDGREFARLVDHYRPLMASLCQSMGLRGADVDDALAEAFAAVYTALPRFEGRSELSTWVYRIAARAILRTRKRYPIPPRGPAGPSDAIDPSPSPAERAGTSEDHQRIWAAVARLEPRQAMAIELYYRQSWPVAQIAGVLECPENTVKTLLARGRERLRELLTDLRVPP